MNIVYDLSTCGHREHTGKFYIMNFQFLLSWKPAGEGSGQTAHTYPSFGGARVLFGTANSCSLICITHGYQLWKGICVWKKSAMPLCISVGWMQHQRKCPYCLLLSKICKKSVSLSYQLWRKLQLLQKKRVLFSVNLVLILFRETVV